MPTLIALAKLKDPQKVRIHLDSSQETQKASREFNIKFTAFLKKKGHQALDTPNLVNKALKSQGVLLCMQGLIEIEKDFGITTGDIRKDTFLKLQEDIFLALEKFYASNTPNEPNSELAAIFQQAQKRIICMGKFGITKRHWTPDRTWEPQAHSHFLKTCDAAIMLLGYPEQVLDIRLRPNLEKKYEAKEFPVEINTDENFDDPGSNAKKYSPNGLVPLEIGFAEDKKPNSIAEHLYQPIAVSVQFRDAIIVKLIPDEKAHQSSLKSNYLQAQKPLKLLVDREELLGSLFARPEILRRLQLDKTAFEFLLSDIENNPYLLNELYFKVKENQNAGCLHSLHGLFKDLNREEKFEKFVKKFHWLERACVAQWLISPPTQHLVPKNG